MSSEAFDPTSHAIDSASFHFPELLGGTLYLPKFSIAGYELQLTKYMVIEVAVVVTMAMVFFPLATALRTGQPPKGRLWNMMEVFLLFLRDQVIRPSIGGSKDAAPFVPYLWAMFFFILFCNLFGLLPWSGSPTGSTAVTFMLAICTFALVNIVGCMKHGIVGYWTGLIPHMELPFVLAIVLKPLIFGIEVLSLVIKHAVLGIRLWANMFAGHLVLGVFLSFIAAAAHKGLLIWLTATCCSVVMCVSMTFLELLVAFLQAYIFTFLSSLFIGTAVHQH